MNIRHIGCAKRNFREGRPAHLKIEKIVIHIVDGSLAACDSTFLNPNLEKPRSAHYCVGKNGEIHQYVAEEDTAFHAGTIVQPTAPLKKVNGQIVNPNFYTIGIEHEGRANDAWTEAMYEASSQLLRGIREGHGIAIARENIWMHREIRADKSCPGFRIDLDKLIRMAAGEPVAFEKIAEVRKTTTAVNVRRAMPRTSGALVRTLAAETDIQVAGFTEGEAVKGNSLWYRLKETDGGDSLFVWAGATDLPQRTSAAGT
jgi:N-acetylmuramoyl-L-alanine amidase